MSFFQNFTNQLQSGLSEGLKEAQKLSQDLQPLAQRTARQFQEKFGSTDDISQLPQEYLDLESQLDLMKDVYSNLHSVTSIYDSEGYDYPNSLKFNELTKSITSKVGQLSQARTTEEAQSIIVSPASKTPKTLNHALATVTSIASQKVKQSHEASSSTSLTQGLDQFAEIESKIGELRIQQDKLIQSTVNAPIQNLQRQFQIVDKSRKNVHNKRLSYDATRGQLKSCKPEKQASLRVQLDSQEDEFMVAIEDCVITMKDCVEKCKMLDQLIDLVVAQLAYHKGVTEVLGQFLPKLQGLKEDDGPVLSDEE